jgi:hypothetical protein
MLVRPSHLRRRFSLLAAILGMIWLVFWPRGPRLEWYRSPYYTLNGKQVRVEVQVPEGWKRYTPLQSAADIQESNFVFVRLDAPKRRTWLPGWLQELCGWEEPFPCYMRICVWGRTTKISEDAGLHLADHCALWVPPFLPRAELTYINRDVQHFNATYRQICESFRVVD